MDMPQTWLAGSLIQYALQNKPWSGKCCKPEAKIPYVLDMVAFHIARALDQVIMDEDHLKLRHKFPEVYRKRHSSSHRVLQKQNNSKLHYFTMIWQQKYNDLLVCKCPIFSNWSKKIAIGSAKP